MLEAERTKYNAQVEINKAQAQELKAEKKKKVRNTILGGLIGGAVGWIGSEVF